MLTAAESRLVERELHGFTDEDVKRVKITRGGKSRGRATPQADTDAIAASIILQAYLDSLRFHTGNL